MNQTGPGQAFFRFVRHWSRLSRLGNGSSARQGRLILVSEAVNALTARGEAATVNAIASQLGIDQSGASRFVTAAIDAGYMYLTNATGDGRRREVSLTTAGQDTVRQAQAWQEEMFAVLTEGWNEAKCDAFRSAMNELIVRSEHMDFP